MKKNIMSQESKNNEKSDKVELNKPLFYSSITVILGLAAIFSIRPEASAKVIATIKSGIMNSLGSVFLLFGLLVVVTVLFLCFSSVGSIRLGGKDDKPEFKTLSWLAMIFTGGCGSSMIYWGTIEWAYYYKGGAGNTPIGLIPGSWEAAEWSAAYGLLHSGITPWALYALVAICVGYLYYVRKVNVLRVSEVCRPILGKHTDGFIGITFDYLYIFAFVAGGATSLTFVSNMVNGFLTQSFGIEFSQTIRILIVIFFGFATAIIIASRLEKGLKLVANLNFYLIYGIVILLFFIGPTQFLIDTTTSAFGLLINNFVRMSLWTDSIRGDGFPQAWTIFYWAWWLIYAPTMGIFLAKISRGRTIRQTGLSILFAGSIGCWVLYIVFGNFGLYLDLNNIYSGADALLGGEDGGLVLAKIFSYWPWQWLVLPVMLILIFVFTLTSLVAGDYSLAATTTKNLKYGDEPQLWNRLFWSFVRPAITIGLVFLNSLVALKNSAIIASVPVLVLVIIMFLGMFKMLKEDNFLQKKQKVLENKEIIEV